MGVKLRVPIQSRKIAVPFLLANFFNSPFEAAQKKGVQVSNPPAAFSSQFSQGDFSLDFSVGEKSLGDKSSPVLLPSWDIFAVYKGDGFEHPWNLMWKWGSAWKKY